MRCPKCDATTKSAAALFKRGAEFTCNTCGAKLRLTGYWWLIILPPLVTLVFPYDWLRGTIMLPVGLVIVIAVVTVIVFKSLVRVELMEEPPKPAQTTD